MNALTLVAATVALIGAAGTALVLARFLPSSGVGRKVALCVYLLFAVAALTGAITWVRTESMTAIFYAALAVFFGVLAHAKLRSPSLE